MVILRKMNGEEFLRFKEYSIEDYARGLVKGRSLLRQQALEASAVELQETLPDGAETEGQYLMTILDGEKGEKVGSSWFFYEEEDGARRAWLCDFLIDEAQRGKGYGEAALAEMEGMAKAAGCAEIALRVWDHNTAAFQLYQKYGYETVTHEDGGSVMRKEL